MMRFKKLCFFCSLMAVIIVLFGCSRFDTPPTQRDVELCLQEDYDSIQAICQYCIDLGTNDVYIQENGSSVLADFETVEIQDSKISSAIQNLKDKGYYVVGKQGNTIYFDIWRGVRDISCGIAYSLNGTSDLTVQFVTECVPLSKKGWYYYVSNYELDRQHRFMNTE